MRPPRQPARPLAFHERKGNVPAANVCADVVGDLPPVRTRGSWARCSITGRPDAPADYVAHDREERIQYVPGEMSGSSPPTPAPRRSCSRSAESQGPSAEVGQVARRPRWCVVWRVSSPAATRARAQLVSHRRAQACRVGDRRGRAGRLVEAPRGLQWMNLCQAPPGWPSKLVAARRRP